MKSQIINILVSIIIISEKFNQLFDIYKKSDNKNLAIERYLNQAGFTPLNLETLSYELKQMYGISDVEIKSAQLGNSKKKSAIMKVPKFAKGSFGLNERRAFAKKHGIKPSGKKSVDFDNAIELYIETQKVLQYNTNVYESSSEELAQFAFDNEIETKGSIKEIGIDNYRTAIINYLNDDDKEIIQFAGVIEPSEKKEKERGIIIKNTEAQTILSDLPKENKTSTKLRDDFPFLDDDDCPNELKVLVTDKLTAFRKYREAREELEVNSIEFLGDEKQNPKFNKLKADEIIALSKIAVEKFELNQEIYNELNHYKETGKVLGKHIIFSKMKLQEKINAMNGVELAKREVLVKNYITKKNKKLKNSKKEKDKLKYSNELEKLDLELEMLRAKMK